MTARYRKVSQLEETEAEENVSIKKLRVERIEKLVAKLHALFWVTGSICLVYYTDMFRLLLSSEINRFAFQISVVSLTVVIGIFMYLGFWLPVVMKNYIPWEVYCPNMIPIATGASVLWFVCLVITFWPIWGLLSPLFIGFVTMGVIFSTHFIPWFC